MLAFLECLLRSANSQEQEELAALIQVMTFEGFRAKPQTYTIEKRGVFRYNINTVRGNPNICGVRSSVLAPSARESYVFVERKRRCAPHPSVSLRLETPLPKRDKQTVLDDLPNIANIARP